MKMLVAIIRPSKLEAVKQALEEIGVRGLTISEVRAPGPKTEETASNTTVSARVNLVPMHRIETALPEERIDSAIQSIRQAASLDEGGDGKIFFINMENAYRVRTGETGADAI